MPRWKQFLAAGGILAGSAGLYAGLRNTQTGDEITEARRLEAMQRDIADSESHPVKVTVDQNGEPTLNHNGIRKGVQILLDGYNLVDQSDLQSGKLLDQTKAALILYFYDCAKKARPAGSLDTHNALIEKMCQKYFDAMNAIALKCYNDGVMIVPDQERNSIARAR